MTLMFESLECRRMLAVDVTVNAAQRFQEIDGLGTAIAWWKQAPYNIPGWTQMFYQDLGASMLRLDINPNVLRGPDDDATTGVTMVEDIQANIAQFDFHYPLAGQNIGDVANASLTQKLDGFKLIGSIWSPPHWMKGEEIDPKSGAKNGHIPYIGGPLNLDSIGGSLIDTSSNLEQFGRYIAAYVKGFEQTYGVPFYAISIQNELAFTEPYNSSVYTPALYVKTLKAVSDAFDHYGITTKIQGPEDVGVGSTDNPAILDRHMSYINAVRADPVAKADLDIYSIHGYATDQSTSSRSPTMWGRYWDKIKTHGLHSWMTETSGESQTISGALRLAGNAMDALVQGNVNGWIYWLAGKDGSNGTDTLTDGIDTTKIKYNAAKHFFRYIRPGSFRIAASPSDPEGVYVASFINDADDRLTTVMLNLGTSTQTINLSTQGGLISSYDTARRTSSSETWSDIGPVNFSNGKASVSMPSKSIVTLVGTLEEAPPPPEPTASSAITGTLFNDANGNGTKDSGEKKNPGRTLYLDADNDGKLDAGEVTATSDANGNYFFGDLFAGSYKVRQVLPSGWRQTLPSSGGISVTLGEDEDAGGKNFGSTDRALVSGTVFKDSDGDKKKDSNESGLSGWKIYIDKDNDGKLDSGERSVTTDSSGKFSFKDLLAGTYVLRIVAKSGYKVTTPTGGKMTVTLAAGASKTGLLFGEKKTS